MNRWGIWNPITERDGEAIRRVASILRYFAKFITSADWEPHTNSTLQYGVYASKFPLQDETFWTVVNRNSANLTGPQMNIKPKSGYHYFDVYHGTELIPDFKGFIK